MKIPCVLKILPCVLKILFSLDLKSLGFDINIKKDTIPAIMKEINIELHNLKLHNYYITFFFKQTFLNYPLEP